MNVLYFTLEDFESIKTGHSINTDLLREFQRQGHCVYAVSPCERRKKLSLRVIRESFTNNNVSSGGRDGVDNDVAVILKPKIGNIQKTRSFIEKGISTVTIGWLLKRAIKKYFKNVKFDLIIYCTPPITFLSAIEYVKKRDNARTYLLLRDIFPDSAIDLGILKRTSLVYKYFRKQEKAFYAISDRIGCMSPANVEYLLAHNPEIDPSKVEVCSNCAELEYTAPSDEDCDEDRIAIRKRYTLPLHKKIFIYGGNLGKPQGIPFIIECLRACQACSRIEDNCHFLIIGEGTERNLLVEYVEEEKPSYVTLMKHLPQKEYERVAAACDVGLIFLDHRFTIPNFPSRLLSYMQAKLPVLACTDPVTDIGRVIVEGGFGWWCESNKAENFVKVIKEILEILAVTDLKCLGQKAYKYLEENYSVENDYQKIMAVAGKNYGKC